MLSETTASFNEGASLDFRRQTPSHPPRRPIVQDSPLELNDRIFDLSDTNTLFPSPVPHVAVDAYHVPPKTSITTPEIVQQQKSQRKPLNSILKNANQATPVCTNQAEDTTANTRRNSTTEMSESRYFIDAADMLRKADSSTHKIVPRRKSSYFDDVQMLYSEAVVAETSTTGPHPDADLLDYASASDLAVLRRTWELEHTSQSLPTIPKDLKTLTRLVSRGHGTLSQSMRRRPSLPFQSPTKVT